MNEMYWCTFLLEDCFIIYSKSQFIFFVGVFADTIIPKEEGKVRREGESVTLSCTYNTSRNNVYLYWYRQNPNRELQYLLFKGARFKTREGNVLDGRFQSTNSHTSTSLTIKSVTLSHSALYYCAVKGRAQWYKVHRRFTKTHTQLETVIHEMTNHRYV